ncbi:MAG: hypothetical protein HEEMFOPI_01456 [Holosporales bacterium]
MIKYKKMGMIVVCGISFGEAAEWLKEDVDVHFFPAEKMTRTYLDGVTNRGWVVLSSHPEGRTGTSWRIEKQNSGYSIRCLGSGYNSNFLYLDFNESRCLLGSQKREWKIEYQSNGKFTLSPVNFSNNYLTESLNLSTDKNNNTSQWHIQVVGLPLTIMERFTEEVQRGFYNAFAALGDTVEKHQNREHHTNEFLRRADSLGNPGFQPLRYFCNALDSRFTRLDDRSNGLDARITHVNDEQSARITSLEAQLKEALGGIATLKKEVETLKSENEKLKGTVNVHQGMVEHIERTTTPIRSVSAGRRARN